MRHANIPMALVAAMVLALTGCETDRAEIPATGTDTGAATITTATVKARADECRDLAIKGDYANALAICRKAAEQGDVRAQYNLGVMYTQGQGVTQDYAEAMKWYRKAAEQGFVRAQFNLGVIYERGMGVTQDYAVAVKWYRKAAELGVPRAQNNLGLMYGQGLGVTQDYAEAAKWFRKAAEQGFAKAQYNIGLIYAEGQGVTQDYAEAVKWYHKAAEQGDALAQFNLGVMYERGRGVTQDYAEAVKWYRKAAKQGHAWAQNNLGGMYRRGLGVTQDYAEAMKWYRKAAEQGAREGLAGVTARKITFTTAVQNAKPVDDLTSIRLSEKSFSIHVKWALDLDLVKQFIVRYEVFDGQSKLVSNWSIFYAPDSPHWNTWRQINFTKFNQPGRWRVAIYVSVGPGESKMADTYITVLSD